MTNIWKSAEEVMLPCAFCARQPQKTRKTSIIVDSDDDYLYFCSGDFCPAGRFVSRAQWNTRHVLNTPAPDRRAAEIERLGTKYAANAAVRGDTNTPAVEGDRLACVADAVDAMLRNWREVGGQEPSPREIAKAALAAADAYTEFTVRTEEGGITYTLKNYDLNDGPDLPMDERRKLWEQWRERGGLKAVQVVDAQMPATVGDRLEAVAKAIQAADGEMKAHLPGEYIGLAQAAITAADAHAADQLKEVREALEALAKLGNGDHSGNSVGNVIAQQALATLNRMLGE